MSAQLDPLIEYLDRTTALTRRDAARVIADVLAYFDQDLETFVRTRHAELQRDGMRNAAIYAQIVADIETWRFTARKTTARQVRRMIYG